MWHRWQEQRRCTTTHVHSQHRTKPSDESSSLRFTIERNRSTDQLTRASGTKRRSWRRCQMSAAAVDLQSALHRRTQCALPRHANRARFPQRETTHKRRATHRPHWQRCASTSDREDLAPMHALHTTEMATSDQTRHASVAIAHKVSFFKRINADDNAP